MVGRLIRQSVVDEFATSDLFGNLLSKKNYFLLRSVVGERRGDQNAREPEPNPALVMVATGILMSSKVANRLTMLYLFAILGEL